MNLPTQPNESAPATEERWEERKEDAKRDRPTKIRLYRCGDRTCGGLDCADCYGEVAAREYLSKENEDE